MNDGKFIGILKVNREQLEHVVRAAKAITLEEEFVVIGSQALLATMPQLPPTLSVSMEIDLYPLANPAAADIIDGTIGELSPFHETFGYYAHGVGPETAVLPRNWEKRLLEMTTAGTEYAKVFCLAPVDIAVSKLIAGRPKDISFVKNMLQLKIIDQAEIFQVLNELDLQHQILIKSRLL